MNDQTPPSRPDEQSIQDYLAGRLSEVAAEEFEARCFSDEALAEELERALEIRAALQPAALQGLDTAAAATEQALQAYLSGRLNTSDAEAFEERLFAEEGLAQEAQLALEVRGALLSEPRMRSAKRTSVLQRHGLLIPIALAATVAALAVGVYWLQAPQESTPVFRRAEQRMGLDVELNGRELTARWQPVPGAIGYELRVYERSGRLLRSVELESAMAALDVGVGPDIGATGPAFVEVVALDNFGQELIRSQRIALLESSGADR